MHTECWRCVGEKRTQSTKSEIVYVYAPAKAHTFPYKYANLPESRILTDES